MMRYRKSALLILLLLLPSLAFGLDVTLRVDGQPLRSIEADRVNIITSDTGILIDVRTDPKSSPPSPPPAPPVPPPKPPPDPTACKRPSGVQVGSPINWPQPGGQQRYNLGSQTIAFPFVTTGNPAYAGQIATGYTSTNPAQRTVWISECPGGELLGRFCSAVGHVDATLLWAQNANQRAVCVLQTRTQYYVNIRNTGCTSNCPFYIIVYTNQKS